MTTAAVMADDANAELDALPLSGGGDPNSSVFVDHQPISARGVGWRCLLFEGALL